MYVEGYNEGDGSLIGGSEENRPLIGKVKEALARTLESQGVELVDLIWRKEAPGMVLRFMVDKPGGVTVDECAHLNQMISRVLDAKDLIQERYTLEVSSPGLDRPLQTRRDFDREMGKLIRVKTRQPIEGDSAHVGILREVDRKMIVIEKKDGSRFAIAFDQVAGARLEVEF